MVTTEPYFSLVQTGASSWSAVLVQDGNAAAPARETQQVPVKPTSATAEWSNRFPRLAIALVALTIFAASVTAEIEYLRQTGHLFR
jgi:hypothetical protein